MGGKAKAPAPPDYTPVAAATMEQANLAAQISREQLAWAKEQYASDKAMTQQVINSALQTQSVNDANAAKDRARYEQIYQPLENDLANDAKSYASPQRTQLEMGKAQAGVAQQFDASRKAAAANLESFGVDPSSTRYAALDIGTRTAEAAAKAGAGNQARENTEAVGRAVRSEAVNVGRGYPGQVAGTYATALQAGNQAVNSGLATTASGANTMGTAPQYMGIGNQAINTYANALTQGYSNQLAAFNAEQNASSGIGSLFGTALGVGARMFMEEGGKVPAEASPTEGGAIDDVPARLNVGEFVVPKDTVAWKGEEFFQKLIEKARKDASRAGARPEMKPAADQSPTFVSRAGAMPAVG